MFETLVHISRFPEGAFTLYMAFGSGWGSPFLHPLVSPGYWYYLSLKYLPILKGQKWYLFLVLIFTSFVACEVKHFLMFIIILIPSFCEFLVNILFLDVFMFFLCIYHSGIYMRTTKWLSYMLQIISVCCLSLIVSICVLCGSLYGL